MKIILFSITFLIVTACNKNIAVIGNHSNLLDTFLQFQANGVSYRWADTIQSGSDTQTIVSFFRAQPIRLSPLATYAYYLTGSVNQDGFSLPLNTNPGATVLLPGAYVYTPADTVILPSGLSGNASIGGTTWTWMMRDTVTVTIAYGATATGTFSATLEHSAGDTTEMLYITHGVFQNLPITP